MSSHYDGNYPTDSYIYWGSAAGYSTSDRTSLYSNGAGGAMSVTDVNGDGRPDVVVGGYSNGSTNLTDAYVYYGPSFISRTALPVYGNRWGVDAKDMDGDGYGDILLAGYHYNGWGNQTYSRIYWGGPAGANANVYDQYAVMGAHGGQIIPSQTHGSGPITDW